MGLFETTRAERAEMFREFAAGRAASDERTNPRESIAEKRTRVVKQLDAERGAQASDAFADAVDTVRAEQLGDVETAAKYKGHVELLAIARAITPPLHPPTFKDVKLSLARPLGEHTVSLRMMFGVGSGQHVGLDVSHAPAGHWVIEYKNQSQRKLSESEQRDLSRALRPHALTAESPPDRTKTAVRFALSHLPQT